MACPLKVLDARLEHKKKSLKKQILICQELKSDILSIENQKRSTYFQLMNGKGVY